MPRSSLESGHPVYACGCMWICGCVTVCACVCRHARMCACVWVWCMGAWAYESVRVCMCVCMGGCMRMYVCVCIFLWVHAARQGFMIQLIHPYTTNPCTHAPMHPYSRAASSLCVVRGYAGMCVHDPSITDRIDRSPPSTLSTTTTRPIHKPAFQHQPPP